MGAYAGVFFGSLFVDLIPVMGPPAWIVMALLQVKFHLNIWLVLVFGVLGSTLGRFWLARYIMPRLSHHFVNRSKNDDLEYLGNKLNESRPRSWMFVVLYSLIPIPTSPLFAAAGIAHVNMWSLLPPFFVGKFASDALMVVSGKYAFHDLSEVAHGVVSWQSVIGLVSGVAIFAALLFTDWRTLIEKKHLKFRWRIWKG